MKPTIFITFLIVILWGCRKTEEKPRFARDYTKRMAGFRVWHGRYLYHFYRGGNMIDSTGALSDSFSITILNDLTILLPSTGDTLTFLPTEDSAQKITFFERYRPDLYDNSFKLIDYYYLRDSIVYESNLFYNTYDYYNELLITP